MSKTRYIKTDFWSDSFIETLSTEEKLLFIYLFSNERVDLCGIYEITIKKISFESGIEIKKVESILDKFAKKGKVYYIDGYIYIKNFVKHLQINPSMQLGIDRSRNALPKPILEAVYRVDTGCTQDDALILIPIPELIPEPKPLDVALQPNEYQESISYLKSIDIENIDTPDYAKNVREDWIAFVCYWTEKGRTGKIRAEGEKTFEIKRRFATWMSRKKEKYQSQQPKQKPVNDDPLLRF